jgi:pyruvate dehydrogenase E1 component alpha subunit/2-oxoisovalerate dehydrogenase E1 component alpha subunit
VDNLSREQRLELYRFLRLTRVLEERLVHLYRQGRIVGGLYRSLGQEATSVGSAYALEPGDVLGPLIRNLGSVLVMGYTPREVLLQHLARAGSPTAGKDCNLHLGSPERGVVPAIAMLGELVPVMAGVALGARMQGKNLVAMTYIGDGGTSTGPFHEGLNLAAVQKLPLIVIVENNGWAYSTPVRKQTAARNLADRAVAYGMPSETIDGNDVLAVYAATRRAVERARSGGGPTLIEARTYRMKGHAEHDGQAYVPRAELEEWNGRDPIERYRSALIASGLMDEQGLEAMDAELHEAVARESELALSAPSPLPEDALKDVYATGIPEAEPSFLRRRW